MHVGTVKDLEKVMLDLQQLLQCTSIPTETRVFALSTLGIALRTYISQVSDITDAKEYHEAERMHREALSFKRTFSALIQLAEALRASHERFGAPSKLDESIELLQEATRLPEAVGAHEGPFQLGRALFAKFLEDWSATSLLSEARALVEQGLHLCPNQHPDRPWIEYLITVTYGMTHHITGGKDAMDKLLAHCKAATAICPKDHPALSLLKFSLAQGIYVANGSYLEYGAIYFLDESIQHAQEASELCPPDSPTRVRCLIALANALGRRTRQTDRIEDLQQCITLRREVLARSDPTFGMHPYKYLSSLSDLTASLLTYGRLVEDVGAFDEAIKHLRHGLTFSTKTDVIEMMKANLAEALHFKSVYSDGRDVQLLLEMIDLLEGVLETTIAAAPQKAEYLTHLGHALVEIYRCEKDFSYLVRARKAQEDAMTLIGDEDNTRWTLGLNLAVTLCLTYPHDSKQIYLDQAAQALDEGLCHTYSANRLRSLVLFQLACLYAIPQSPYHNPERSLDYTLYALLLGNAGGPSKARHALSRLEELEKCIEDQDLLLRRKVLEVYRATSSILPRIAYFGLNARTRLDVLSVAPDLASRAACEALALSRHELAIELLEEGRGVFWAQRLRLRTSFDSLPADLARELEKASRELGRDTDDHEGSSRIGVSEHFYQLLDRARRLPGYSRFLLPDPFLTLAEAAAHGPVVILLTDKHSQCHAMIVESTSSTVRHVLLPGMRAQDLKDIRSNLSKSNHTVGRSMSRSIKVVKGHSPVDNSMLEPYARLWAGIMRSLCEVLNLKVSS